MLGVQVPLGAVLYLLYIICSQSLTLFLGQFEHYIMKNNLEGLEPSVIALC